MVTTEEYLLDSVSYELSRTFTDVPFRLIRARAAVWSTQHPLLWEHLRKSPDTLEHELRRLLWNWCLDYCHHARAKRIGYEFEDLHFYSLAALRELVTAVSLGEDVQRARVPSEGNAPRRPSEGGNGMVMLIDVDRALGLLPPTHRRALWAAVEQSWDQDEVSTKATRRALRALQRVLGGPAPGRDPGDVVPEEPEVDPTQIVALAREGKVEL